MEIGLISSLAQLLVASLLDRHRSHFCIRTQYKLRHTLIKFDVHLVIGYILNKLHKKLAEPTLNTNFLHVSSTLLVHPSQVKENKCYVFAHVQVPKLIRQEIGW